MVRFGGTYSSQPASGSTYRAETSPLEDARNRIRANKLARRRSSIGRDLGYNTQNQAYLNQELSDITQRTAEEQQVQAAARNVPDIRAVHLATALRRSTDPNYGMAGLNAPMEVALKAGQTLPYTPGVRQAFQTQEELLRAQFRETQALRGLGLEAARNALSRTRNANDAAELLAEEEGIGYEEALEQIMQAIDDDEPQNFARGGTQVIPEQGWFVGESGRVYFTAGENAGQGEMESIEVKPMRGNKLARPRNYARGGRATVDPATVDPWWGYGDHRSDYDRPAEVEGRRRALAAYEPFVGRSFDERYGPEGGPAPRAGISYPEVDPYGEEKAKGKALASARVSDYVTETMAPSRLASSRKAAGEQTAYARQQEPTRYGNDEFGRFSDEEILGFISKTIQPEDLGEAVPVMSEAQGYAILRSRPTRWRDYEIKIALDDMKARKGSATQITGGPQYPTRPGGR